MTDLDELEALAKAGIVRKLEWPAELQRGQQVRSGGGLISYAIEFFGGTEWEDRNIYRWTRASVSWSNPLCSYTEAKAAAQADYAKVILSAINQPLGSMLERFACDECAAAIRALQAGEV